MILTNPHILTRMMYRTTLTHEDVACFGGLATEYLDAQSFTFRFTAVLRTTYTFFMCHFLLILTD